MSRLHPRPVKERLSEQVAGHRAARRARCGHRGALLAADGTRTPIGSRQPASLAAENAPAGRRPRRTGRSRPPPPGGQVVELGAPVHAGPALRSAVEAIASTSSRARRVRRRGPARRSPPARRGAGRSPRPPRPRPSPVWRDGLARSGAARRPRAGRPWRAALRSSRRSVVGAVPVGLVDDVDVADLQDPGLGGLDAVAHPRGQQHQRGVGEPGDLDLALAHADGLDQHHVEAGGVEDPDRLRGRPGQASEVAARGHRTDVDARGRARGPPSAPGRRAARRRRTATTGRPPAPRRACRPRGARRPARSSRSTCRRPGSR